MPTPWHSRWLPLFACTNPLIAEILCKAQIWCIGGLQHLWPTPLAWSRAGCSWCCSLIYCSLQLPYWSYSDIDSIQKHESIYQWCSNVGWRWPDVIIDINSMCWKPTTMVDSINSSIWWGTQPHKVLLLTLYMDSQHNRNPMLRHHPH